jgi:hypothetical protein
VTVPKWLSADSTARLAADAETDGTSSIGVEDTLDGEYGRLLERAMPKLSNRSEVASLTAPTWNQVAAFVEAMRRLRDQAGFAA